MSNLFVANPDALKAEGNTVLDQSAQFGQNVEKVYTTVDEMLTSAYLSPAARALGTQIRTFREDLDKMTKVINDYGTYCLTSSNTVIKNEENIIDNFTTQG